MVIFRGPQKYFLGVVCTYVDAFYAGIQKPKLLLYILTPPRLFLFSLGPLGGHFPLWGDLAIFRLDFLRSAAPTMGKKAEVQKKIGKRNLYIFPALYILILTHFTPVLKKKKKKKKFPWPIRGRHSPLGGLSDFRT